LGFHDLLPFLEGAPHLQQVPGHPSVGNDYGKLHGSCAFVTADSFKMNYLPIQFEDDCLRNYAATDPNCWTCLINFRDCSSHVDCPPINDCVTPERSPPLVGRARKGEGEGQAFPWRAFRADIAAHGLATAQNSPGH
jgi:hypothetical protein